MKETSKVGQCPRPAKPIEIYEFEGYVISFHGGSNWLSFMFLIAPSFCIKR